MIGLLRPSDMFELVKNFMEGVTSSSLIWETLCGFGKALTSKGRVTGHFEKFDVSCLVEKYICSLSLMHWVGCVRLLTFYAFIFVICGPGLCALVRMWYDDRPVITGGETLCKIEVENASNLKVKCWYCLVKTAPYTIVWPLKKKPDPW